ncbi:hypothetical protein MMC26_006541 [Xylographa opegraphella]|nr:hypothetical protein [Xylographa opegraphella]
MSTAAQHQGRAKTKELPNMICPICEKGYTRRETVKNHFPACVRRNGNPNNVAWDAHPSCQPKRASRAEKVRPVKVPAAVRKGRRNKQPKVTPAYVCMNCHKSFPRRDTVKNVHFPVCVERNGNPNNYTWDAHPSCWLKNKGTVPGDGRKIVFKITDDEDQPMTGYEEQHAATGVIEEHNGFQSAASDYDREDDEAMMDVDSNEGMTPQQLKDLETYVRDGKPLNDGGVNWMFEFQDVGEDGYVMPSVFYTHGEGSNEHIHRAVVPHHSVHPGLAHGPNAPFRTNAPGGGMNDPMSDSLLPSDTSQPRQSSVKLQPGQNLDNMAPRGPPPSFYIASSLPGAPLYGRTGGYSDDEAHFPQAAMASSDTVPNTGTKEGDRTSEFGPALPTNDFLKSKNHATNASFKSKNHAHLYAENTHGLPIDPRLTKPVLQPAFQESPARSGLHKEQSHGSHNHAASLPYRGASNTGRTPHGNQNKAPYPSYFEKKAKNPESLEAFAKRMEGVKEGIGGRLRDQGADPNLADKLFQCPKYT